MATTRNNDRIRYRYGICLNDNCEKCKSKEVQEIPARKDFVCSECGKPLRECPPPKKKGNGKLIAIIIGILVVLAIIVGIVSLSGGSESKPEPIETTVVPVDSDSIRIAREAAEEAAKQQKIKDSLEAVAAAEAQKQDGAQKRVSSPTSAPKPAASSSKNLGYAIFKGSWPNDVNGRMVFKASHAIDSKDPKKRVAEPGDYVIGEWSDGHLVQGIWYGSDNQVKGSIIIGK